MSDMEDIFYVDLDGETLNEHPLENTVKKDNLSFGDRDFELNFPFDFQEESKKEKDKQQDLIDQVLKDIQAADSGFDFQETKIQNNEISNIFEQKQIEFLTGKVIKKDIISSNGKIIAKKGERITPDLIKQAKLERKLIEVIMNCK